MSGTSPKEACIGMGFSVARYNHLRNMGFITPSVGNERKRLSEDDFQRLYRLVFLVDDCGFTIQGAANILDADCYTAICAALRAAGVLASVDVDGIAG